VEHRKDNDAMSFHSKIDAVGKAPQRDAPDISVGDTEACGMLSQEHHAAFYFGDELCAQSGSLSVIPRSRLFDL
jgi:hypothetical protein